MKFVKKKISNFYIIVQYQVKIWNYFYNKNLYHYASTTVSIETLDFLKEIKHPFDTDFVLNILQTNKPKVEEFK